MLARATRSRPNSMAELIDPDLAARLDALDVRSRKVFAGKLQGERRSKRRGKSVDFDDYREYVPGDDLRHLDWNVFARLDRFFIKVFQEEEDLALHLVIDASESMNAGVPNKLLFAARLAMALGYVGLVNNNRVAVSVLGGPGSRRSARTERLEPVRGRRNVPRLAQFLIDALFGTAREESGALVDADRPTGEAQPAAEFAAACRLIAATPLGKGVTLVVSDLLLPPLPGPKPEPGYSAGLRLLAGLTSSDVHLLQVLSPGEIDPAAERTSLSGEPDAGGSTNGGTPAILGDLRLSDAETGRTTEITVTLALLERYRAAARRYVDDARLFCLARGISHALTPSDSPIGALLLDELRRRGVLA